VLKNSLCAFETDSLLTSPHAHSLACLPALRNCPEVTCTLSSIATCSQKLSRSIPMPCSQKTVISSTCCVRSSNLQQRMFYVNGYTASRVAATIVTCLLQVHMMSHSCSLASVTSSTWFSCALSVCRCVASGLFLRALGLPAHSALATNTLSLPVHSIRIVPSSTWFSCTLSL
jgi:hypothetical protein